MLCNINTPCKAAQQKEDRQKRDKIRTKQATVPLDTYKLQHTTSAKLDCCISCVHLRNKTIKGINCVYHLFTRQNKKDLKMSY